jgi:hypothetical protein
MKGCWATYKSGDRSRQANDDDRLRWIDGRLLLTSTILATPSL